jgi:hypothetical protein
LKRLDMEIPVELFERLQSAARLPMHREFGVTLEVLVIQALEEGLIGIELSCERFDDTKPIADAILTEFEPRTDCKSNTRIAVRWQGRRSIRHR